MRAASSVSRAHGVWARERPGDDTTTGRRTGQGSTKQLEDKLTAEEGPRSSSLKFESQGGTKKSKSTTSHNPSSEASNTGYGGGGSEIKGSVLGRRPCHTRQAQHGSTSREPGHLGTATPRGPENLLLRKTLLVPGNHTVSPMGGHWNPRMRSWIRPDWQDWRACPGLATPACRKDFPHGETYV